MVMGKPIKKPRVIVKVKFVVNRLRVNREDPK